MLSNQDRMNLTVVHESRVISVSNIVLEHFLANFTFPRVVEMNLFNVRLHF